MMKTYAAVGYFKFNGKERTQSVAMNATTRKNFTDNLRANEFVDYIVISEKKLEELKKIDNSYDMFNEVKKLTSNYRMWDFLTDYLM